MKRLNVKFEKCPWCGRTVIPILDLKGLYYKCINDNCYYKNVDKNNDKYVSAYKLIWRKRK